MACADNVDNDTDGHTDCADPDCVTASNCVIGTPGSCTNALPIGPLPFVVSADTTGASNDAGLAAGGCTEANGGTFTGTFGQLSPDHVYAFVPPSTGRYQVRLDETAASARLGVSVLTTCPATAAGQCELFTTIRDVPAWDVLEPTLTAGTTYFIVVDGEDGVAAGYAGPYTLRVEALTAENDCNDGVDSDGDGATDCNDADCCGLNSCAGSWTGCAVGGPGSCATPFAVAAVPFSTTGDTFGQSNEFDTDGKVACGYADAGNYSATFGKQSSDHVYAITPPSSGWYRATVVTTGADARLGLLVATSCPANNATGCTLFDPGLDGPGTTSIEFAVVAGVVTYLVVDGADTLDSGAYGTYSLSIEAVTAEGDCNDLQDSDGDGATDCADPNCCNVGNCGAAACAAETVCDDTVDNDNNGATDCADAACFGATGCTTEALCDDGKDNDADGLTDCADADCWSAASCGNASCAQPRVLAGALPLVVSSDLANAADDLTGPDYSCPGFKYGPVLVDHVYRFTPTVSGRYTILPNPGLTSSPGITYFVTTGCDLAGADSCLAAQHAQIWGTSRLDIALVAGTAYFISVDQRVSLQDTTYGFTLSLAGETSCSDTSDNDSDGNTDCADPSCTMDPSCRELLLCGDTVDNDNDGLTDCADPDCSDAGPCNEFGAACFDGVDNDNDAYIDCLDEGACVVDQLRLTAPDNSLAGDTTGAVDVFQANATCAALAAKPDGLERMYLFAALAPGLYRFTVTGTGSGSARDHRIAVYPDCPGVATCLAGADTGGPGAVETVDVTLGAGAVVTVVAGMAPGEVGRHTVEVVLVSPAEVCTDTVDNDNNGATDCADAACTTHPACQSSCSNPTALPSGGPPWVVSGTVSAADGDHFDAAALECEGWSPVGRVVDAAGQAGNDVFISLVEADGMRLRATLTGVPDGAGSRALFVAGPCYPSGTTGCLYGQDLYDETAIAGAAEVIEFDAWAGRFLVIDAGDAWSASDGPFSVTIERIEQCMEAGDQDLDGADDATDPDCRGWWNSSCANPNVVIGSLPWAQHDVRLSSNGLDDVSGSFTTACVDYLDGNLRIGEVGQGIDNVYSYTPSQSGAFVVALTEDENILGWGGLSLFVTSDCPAGGAGTCIASSASSAQGSGPLTTESVHVDGVAGTTYFIIVNADSTIGLPPTYALQLLPYTAELACFNSVDDDTDGATDCADADCAAYGGCPSGCGTATVIGALPYRTLGDTTQDGNSLSAPDGACAGLVSARGLASPEHVFTYTASASGPVTVRLEALAGGADHALYVATDCADVAGTCLGGADGGGNGAFEVVAFQASANQTYTIVVDGWANDSSVAGPYELTVAPNETACGDTVDNDGDGATDCADSDCYPQPSCQVSVCAAGTVIGALPFTTAGDTTGGGNHLGVPDATCPISPGSASLSSALGGGSEDHVFVYTATADATVQFNLTSTFDAALTVTEDCSFAAANACIASADGAVDNGTETITAALTNGQTVYIIVDGWSSTQNLFGPYTLEVLVP